MITSKKAANAVGGKTARACDSCLRKRARWYCAADDAFLCQGCDSSVHSANQLASRHERVRLEKGAANKTVFGSPNTKNSTPAWLQGFTRKARTPRHPKPAKAIHGSAFTNPLAIVPEIGGEEEADRSPDEESEEQLLYRVPVFDPFSAELCNAPNNMADALAGDGFALSMSEKGLLLHDEARHDDIDLDTHNGLILPSDMELAEFAADVESLLGTGLDEDYCGMEGLGLGLGLGVGVLECIKEDDHGDDMGNFFEESRKVKVEDDVNGVEEVVDCQMDVGFDLERETIDWNFDYEINGEEEKMVVDIGDGRNGLKEEEDHEEEEEEEVKRKLILSLNYEGVISAWASQGCPWTDGIRPELNADGSWPDFMGFSHSYGGVGGSHVRDDGGREARVSRYREKRRTRLFSKKIRYEVRKLNAEKRPRMKGRFVKRTPFSGPSLPSYHLINTK